MKRLKAFWYVYKRSLIDVEYYKDLLKVKMDFSLKYFFSLAVMAAMITTLRVAVPTIPRVKATLNNLINQFVDAYPDDLEFTVKDGMWEINKKEPYVITTPPVLQLEDAAMPTNLIVFDHEGTIDDLNRYDTFAVINSVNLIARNSQSNIEAYPLDSLPDGKLTKADMMELTNNVRSFVRFVPLIIVVFVLIGTLFYFILYRMLYLLVVALLLLAAGYLKGVREKFSTYYKLSLHTLTLALTVELVFILLGVETRIPFWFLGMNLIFGLTVIHYLISTKALKS